MSQQVVDAARRMVARMPVSTRAQRLDAAGAARIRSEYGAAVPAWYVELLQTVPLAGRIVQFTRNGETWDVWWADDKVIALERHAIPGVRVAAEGYVPVAIDPTGSGNPFFVKFESDDPPLLQLLHDRVGPDGELAGAVVVVCGSLTGFFEEAVHLA
jgi:hypothetical protein